ncbi:hypothetical protein SNEBB_005554 [Seison nebaliae]|nr:hypothetical protein SNEBB_005554 [Seison nebaliae]
MSLLSDKEENVHQETDNRTTYNGRSARRCRGYCITGPTIRLIILNYITVILVTSAFYLNDAQQIYEIYGLRTLLPTIIALYFIFLFMTMSAITDPGILPRADKDEQAFIRKKMKKAAIDTRLTVFIRSIEITVRFCPTCNMFRMPRSSHCSKCDNCVENFDHHCPWLGNCIGKRNYRFFYLYLVSICFFIINVITISLTNTILLFTQTMDLAHTAKQKIISYLFLHQIIFLLFSKKSPIFLI